jgi:hypothetical protein
MEWVERRGAPTSIACAQKAGQSCAKPRSGIVKIAQFPFGPGSCKMLSSPRDNEISEQVREHVFYADAGGRMPESAGYALGPEAIAIAAEAFGRSWHFVEQDPVLAGQERQALKAELARAILSAAGRGERDHLRIANRAIGEVREKLERTQKGRRAAQVRWFR